MMNIGRYLARNPSASGIIYVALVIGLWLMTMFMTSDLVERYRARSASLEMLTRLEERSHGAPFGPGETAGPRPPGSPFLKGQSATIANAAFLERITSAIANAGGVLVSSDVERQTSQSKDGYLSVTATCELEQSGLQQLLYDLEAGMPFLFVDQLVVQGPTTENDRIRAVLSLSGLWPGAN
jgi:general secretion pathway protein M